MGKALGRAAGLCIVFGALVVNMLVSITAVEGQTLSRSNNRAASTSTPIKHLIVVIGENRSFDNVFATYVPPDPKQSVWNLLSQGIVQKTGGPGLNVKKALQQRAVDHDTYQLAPPRVEGGEFSPLPQPSTTLNALPKNPCDLAFDIGYGNVFCSDIGLADQSLLTKGGTGQYFYDVYSSLGSFYPVPDCRYPAADSQTPLPNAPYSLREASTQTDVSTCPRYFLPIFRTIAPTAFSDNTGDPVHRFFQMWQQNDCSFSHGSAQDPSGCLHDLYTWVATSVGWQITKDGTQTPPPQPPEPEDDQATYQGGIAMGFYNMATGDWPYFQLLSQKYAISDNYHQPIMGGTGPNSQFMMTGDVFYYTDLNGKAATPPDRLSFLIENPDPQQGSNNYYKHASPNIATSSSSPNDPGNTSIGGLVNCYDQKQPGVKTIQDYLKSLPYRPFNNVNSIGNCASGHFYQVDNEYPSYNHLGGMIEQGNEFPASPDFAIGPQTIPTIGDSLSAANISWKYYGEGFRQAAADQPRNTLYCAICSGFQYSKSIMTGKGKDGLPLRSNLQDLDSFFTDLSEGTLGAVSFVKPDILLDGHPGTSTPPLFEAFVQNIISAVQKQPSLWQTTAILITFDESGGYYDSGYIQPIDFFGDGPRTVLIAVSNFAKKGFVDHTYTDHASILKFIERNWRLKPLSPRSRDNLPNPVTLAHEPYFPRNSPAIGDLMTMFQF